MGYDRESKCDNCGDIGYYNPHSGAGKPKGWVSKGWPRKDFCSNKCKDEYTERNEKSSSKPKTPKSPEERLFKKMQDKEYDDELKLKKIQDKEDFEKDKDKSKILKEEGKKWMSLWYGMGKNGRITFGSILGGFVAFSIISFAGEHIAVGIILSIFSLVGLVIGSLILKEFAKDFFK